MKAIPISKYGQVMVELGYQNRHVFDSYKSAAQFADSNRKEGVPASIWFAQCKGWTMAMPSQLSESTQ